MEATRIEYPENEEGWTKRILALKERLAAVEQLFLDQIDLEKRNPEQWRVQIGDLSKRLEATDARFRTEMKSLETAVESLQKNMMEAREARDSFLKGQFFKEEIAPLQRSIGLLHESLRAAEDKLTKIRKQ